MRGESFWAQRAANELPDRDDEQHTGEEAMSADDQLLDFSGETAAPEGGQRCTFTDERGLRCTRPPHEGMGAHRV